MLTPDQSTGYDVEFQAEHTVGLVLQVCCCCYSRFIFVHILYMLNLTRITSEFCIMSMFLIVDLQRVFYSWRVEEIKDYSIGMAFSAVTFIYARDV